MKLLSENLGNGIEECSRDGWEEEVGQHVDHGGGDGEGGEQRAGVWGDLGSGCVVYLLGPSCRELRTVVDV